MKKIVFHLVDVENFFKKQSTFKALMDFKKITVQRGNLSHVFVIEVEDN